MARKKKIKYRVYIDRDFGTISTRNKKTGKLTGRRKVSGFGDKTAVRRIRSPKKYSGQIFGRTKPIPVRASKSRRGTVRKRI